MIKPNVLHLNKDYFFSFSSCTHNFDRLMIPARSIFFAMICVYKLEEYCITSRYVLLNCGRQI